MVNKDLFFAVHVKGCCSAEEKPRDDELRKSIKPLPMALTRFLCPVESLNIFRERFLALEDPYKLLEECFPDTMPSWIMIHCANKSDPCREDKHDGAQMQRTGQWDLSEGKTFPAIQTACSIAHSKNRTSYYYTLTTCQ